MENCGLSKLDTYHTLLQTRWGPSELFSILGTLCVVGFFQLAEVVANVSHR